MPPPALDVRRPGNSEGRIMVYGIPQRYVTVVLTFLATFVCYVERVGFSLAYSHTANQVGVDQSTKGWVLSAFYYGYASSQIPGGWTAQRLGGRRVLLLSFVLWSVTCMFTPTAPKPLSGIVIARLLVGIAQGFIFPSIHAVLAVWIPPHERSRSVSLTTSGMYFGAAAAMLFLPGLVATRGPSSVFTLVGGLGFVWAAIWLRYSAEPPGTEAAGGGLSKIASASVILRSNSGGLLNSMEIGAGPGSNSRREQENNGGETALTLGLGRWALSDGEETPSKGAKAALLGLNNSSSKPPVISLDRGPAQGSIKRKGRSNADKSKIPWMQLMLSWPVWAIVVNNFTFHYALYVLMNWLPTYFDQYLKASLSSIGWAKMLPYFVMFVFSNVGGVIADYLITRRIASVTYTRKLLNNVGFALAAVALLSMPMWRSVSGAVLCSSVALGACALARAGFAVNHMDIAPRFAGIVMGLSNTAGTIAGVVGVAATGLILDAARLSTGREEAGWVWVFATPAILCVLSSVFFSLFATGERIFD